jgi:tRNA A37 threonylcarbamoyladenosine modification protein TsaB
MNLEIKIENKTIKIALKKGKRVIDETTFPDEHNLMEKLLPEIDRLLKRNKLSIADVAKAKVISDTSDSYTTTRIAKTVANAINWSRTLNI